MKTASLFFLFSLVAFSFSASASNVSVGDSMPETFLQDATGAEVEVKPEEGEVEVLVFVSQYQDFCQKAVNDLIEIEKQLNNSKLKIRLIWISTTEPRVNIPVDWIEWFDPERKTASAFGVIVSPTTILITDDLKVGEYIPSHPLSYKMHISTSIKLHLGLIDQEEFNRLRQQNSGDPIDEDHAKAVRHANLAKEMTHRGEIEKAERHFRIAIDLAPEDVAIVTAFSKFLIDQKNIEEAKSLLKKVLEAQPRYSLARFQRARVLVIEEKYEEAEEFLVDILPLYTRKEEVFFELGTIYEHQGKWQQAMGNYRKAAETLFKKN